MHTGADAVILMLSEVVPASTAQLYMDLAPRDAQTPFSVYRIVGNREEETLSGNVGGAGYLVQIDTAADNPVAARNESANIRRLLEGRQRTSEGLAVRVDFDSERTLGPSITEDSNDIIYSWSADYTIWPGD